MNQDINSVSDQLVYYVMLKKTSHHIYSLYQSNLGNNGTQLANEKCEKLWLTRSLPITSNLVN